MNDLISIIVPIYNAEPTISSCIKSVLCQTYTNFELILLDDGSQDNSKSICEKMGYTDNRIFFYSQDHKGVSSARNLALRLSKGIYIFFLDSDDIIHPHLLELLHSLLKETSSDLATENYFYFKTEHFSDYADRELVYNEKDYLCLPSQVAIDMFMLGQTNTLYGIGGIMLRRSIIQSLLFDETLSKGEDTKFIYQLLLQKINIIILQKKWYYYRIHKKKAMQLESCQSIYNCESYIRDNELNSDRLSNALLKENYILKLMCEWFILAKKEKKHDLCRYLKQIALAEKNLEIYPLSNLKIRIKIFIIFHCFPLYEIFRFFYAI
jgi:glycosyltransferase involved in cell wall biosynthesis